MTVETSNKIITADELLRMGDIGRCELVYGELIMMSPAGAEHGEVAARLGVFVGAFVIENALGKIFAAETGFKLATDPETVRAPDVAYVEKSRVALGMRTRGFFTGPPDLAVEVVSPDDTKREVADKVNMWLAHGTKSVWVADSEAMTIAIHRTAQLPIVFKIDDVLKDDLLPGFELPLRKVFLLP
jgi:Uma2 family endonuclease